MLPKGWQPANDDGGGASGYLPGVSGYLFHGLPTRLSLPDFQSIQVGIGVQCVGGPGGSADNEQFMPVEDSAGGLFRFEFGECPELGVVGRRGGQQEPVEDQLAVVLLMVAVAVFAVAGALSRVGERVVAVPAEKPSFQAVRVDAEPLADGFPGEQVSAGDRVLLRVARMPRQSDSRRVPGASFPGKPESP